MTVNEDKQKILAKLYDKIKQHETFIEKQTDFYVMYEDMGQTATTIRALEVAIKLIEDEETE